METTLIVSAFALVLAACALALWQQRAIIADVRADNRDLRSRMYVSKGQPPVGVDMVKGFEKKEEQREQRRAEGPQPEPSDPGQRLKLQLLNNERKRTAAKTG
jgi:hypothetical protein